MNNGHVLTDEVIKEIETALRNDEKWMAYNQSFYFIEKEELYFFKTKEEAQEFASNNISDHDSFHVIHFETLRDVFLQIPYDESSGIQVHENAPVIGLAANHIDLSLQLSAKNKQEPDFNNLNYNVMNEQNLDYLKDNIKYLGFGEKLYPALEKNIMEELPEFSLPINMAVKEDLLRSSLHFRKSDTSDMYFLNSFDSSLQKPGKEELKQSFKLDRGRGITAKEAYNLLDGRSVYKEFSKEGQKYHSWQKLDFENKDDKGNFKMLQFHDNYGYNLAGAVKNLPLVRLDSEQEAQLIRSLERGNLHGVTGIQGEQEMKLFIAANPQFKTMDIYDSEMKPLSREQKEALQYQPDSAVHKMLGKKAEVSEEKNMGNPDKSKKKEDQALTNDNSENKGKEQAQTTGKQKGQNKGEKQRNNHSKDQAKDTGLLPKKRQGTGKGLTM